MSEDSDYDNAYGPAPKPVIGIVVEVKTLVKLWKWLKDKIKKDKTK